MIRISLLLPFLLIAFGGFAQNLVNNGAKITVPSGTYLKVSGDVTLQNSSALTNNGHVSVGGDWSETNATSGYGGTGWLWFSGSADQQFAGTSSLPNLRINNGQTVELMNDLAITSALDFNNNGSVSLGNYSLTLSNGATLSNYNATSYAKTTGTGGLKQTVASSSVVFPVGKSTYNPATIANSGTSDVFSVRVADAVLSGGTSGSSIASDAVNRTWFVEENTAGGSNASLTLQWNASDELSGFDRTSSGVSHYTGGAWSGSTFTAATANGSYWQQSMSGITSFSPFGVQDNASPFPVEWIFFDAERTSNDSVLLQWATASETNNYGFVVERRLEHESEFSGIGWVAGNGSTAETTGYAITAPDNNTGKSFYRLKQVDFNGNFTYTETREVMGVRATLTMEMFPNPAAEVVYLRIASTNPHKVEVIATDAVGKIVFQQTTNSPAHGMIAPISIQQWAAGVYFFSCSDGNSSQLFRIVKL